MVHCREISQNDLGKVVEFLTHGFTRKRDYWVQAIERLTRHPTPPGFPKYGYVMEADGELVGILLLICTSLGIGGTAKVRCNVSSWYVAPAFRGYGAVLSMRAVRHKHATYFNTSPDINTWATLEAQGFQRFASGRFAFVPVFRRSRSNARVRVRALSSDTRPGLDLEQAEIDLLLDHTGYGCMSLICEEAGHRFAFVFGLHVRHHVIPVAHLVYCRDIADFFRLAGPIGRFLALRGYLVVACETNGPAPHVLGKYTGNRPKYCKGPDQMRPGDVAYSEQVMFGY